MNKFGQKVFIGFSLMLALAPAQAEQKQPVITYDTAACQISSDWCVGRNKPKKYLDDEMLLLYDSSMPVQHAEKIMSNYRLTQKRSDDLESVQTSMVTVATNGQDPLVLTEKIKRNEREVDANLSTLFFAAATTPSAGPPVPVYPQSLTGIAAAHQFTKGAGVKICLIDTPVDLLHRSLDNSRVRRMELIPSGNAANQKHGTEVAGILISPNPMIGIAPDASLLAVSAFSQNSKGGYSSTAGLISRAMDLCIREGVDVINLSFAGSNDSLVKKLIQKAVSSGIVVVASAGNGGPSAEPAYPAALENVLAVTAVDRQEKLFGLANRGNYIDLAAPGVDILTTSPRGSFNTVSGTSMATAHVTGVIALLLSLHKQGFDPALLERTATDLGRQGRDNEFGYGLIQADRALSALGAGKLR